VNGLRVTLALASAVLAWPARAAERKFDVCSVLTAREIEAVQGDRVTATKASEPERVRFAVSQCFYTLATFSKSVSLEVTRPDPDHAGEGPRDQWIKLFQRAAGSEAGGERENQRRKKASKPQRVAGVGDEAFWIQTGPGGALYVLKNNAYIRISVGGAHEGSVKLEKSKALAKKAVKRL